MSFSNSRGNSYTHSMLIVTLVPVYLWWRETMPKRKRISKSFAQDCRIHPGFLSDKALSGVLHIGSFLGSSKGQFQTYKLRKDILEVLQSSIKKNNAEYFALFQWPHPIRYCFLHYDAMEGNYSKWTLRTPNHERFNDIACTWSCKARTNRTSIFLSKTYMNLLFFSNSQGSPERFAKRFFTQGSNIWNEFSVKSLHACLVFRAK